MKITDALQHIRQLYIETAPFVYFVERSPTYIYRMRVIFSSVDAGNIEIVTSVITLTEVRTKPLKAGNQRLQFEYVSFLQTTRHIQLVSITSAIAVRAAYLRTEYNLKTPDALQVATALETNCDAFLTNDVGIKRVKEIKIIMIDQLELDIPPLPPNA